MAIPITSRSHHHPAAIARDYTLDHLEIDPSWAKTAYDQGNNILQATGVNDPTAIKDQKGRTYQGHSEGTYWLPNDIEEQNRLDHQHRMVCLILDGKLGLAPVKNPKSALDIATGTGIWALQYAQQHPDCKVIGSDLSVIQPVANVPNCSFIRSDVEKDDWDFPEKFDYIHLRYVVSCFDNPHLVIKKAFEALKPGGYIEFFDVPAEMQALEGSVKGTPYDEWHTKLWEAGDKLDRDIRKPYKYKEWLEDAGFVNVQRHIVAAPLNEWPKDHTQKEIGRSMLPNYLSLAEMFEKFLVQAGHDPEEMVALRKSIQNAMRDPTLHIFQEMTTVYGKKP